MINSNSRDVVKILPAEYPEGRWKGVLPIGETIDPAKNHLFEVAAYFPSVTGTCAEPRALVADRTGLAIEVPMGRLRIQRNIPHDYNGPTGQFYKPQQAND